MSICRTTIVDPQMDSFRSRCRLNIIQTDADDYIANFESMFPECEKSINSRVGPTTVVSNSVYADEAAIEKTGSGPRQAFMDKHKDRIKNVTTYIGEVTLSK